MSSSVSEILPALDRAEEQLEVMLEIRSIKHDCYVAYKLSKHEIENDYTESIIRDMKYRLLDFIQEKLNESSTEDETRQKH